jgi:predicted PurR-regulated permease PerM
VENGLVATQELRVVSIRPRTIFVMLGIATLVGAGLAVVYLAWHVLTWILIAIIFAAALNPAVEFFERRGLRRGWATAAVFVIVIAALTGLGLLVVRPLVDEVTSFVAAIPDIIDDLTRGRGPLGFLQDRYQIVDRVRAAVEAEGASGLLGLTDPALNIARSVATAVVGVITIAFLTFFMLLEGPRTIERLLGVLPEPSRDRWRRVGANIYRTIGGYVTGNLLISFIAGVSAAIVLLALGSDFAVALAVLVAILDLIPLAGATLAAIVVTTVVVVEADWVRGLIVASFFLVYQQVENQFLQPLIYGRMVQLSPLVVLCAVLIGAELAGIFGVLIAIPVAGSLLAIVSEVLLYRREAAIETPPGVMLGDAERPETT